MKKEESLIGFGGGCHWCTEAIFQSIPEVHRVKQGWIKSDAPYEQFSEAVLVYFNAEEISLERLIHIRVKTHSVTSSHFKRNKYRSAVYAFGESQMKKCSEILNQMQKKYDQQIFTKVLFFRKFKLNQENYLNYYYDNPDKPFCQTYIAPKLKILEDL